MKYTFRHFVIDGGRKVEIRPTENNVIANKCKRVWLGVVTGKEHVLKSQKEGQAQ